MSESLKELVEIPQNFIKEGTHVSRGENRVCEHDRLGAVYCVRCAVADFQFINRCTKPTKKGV